MCWCCDILYITRLIRSFVLLLQRRSDVSQVVSSLFIEDGLCSGVGDSLNPVVKLVVNETMYVFCGKSISDINNYSKQHFICLKTTEGDI